MSSPEKSTPMNYFGENGKCGFTDASHGELGSGRDGEGLSGAVDAIWWMKTRCSARASSPEWLGNGGDTVAIAGARGESEEANGDVQEMPGCHRGGHADMLH